MVKTRDSDSSQLIFDHARKNRRAPRDESESPPGTKRCVGKCKKVLPLTSFSDPKQKACRECKRAYYLERRADPERYKQMLEKQRAWKRENRERHKKYNNKWRKENPEKVREIRDRHYEAKRKYVVNRYRTDEAYREHEKTIRHAQKYISRYGEYGAARILENILKKEIRDDFTEKEKERYEKVYRIVSDKLAGRFVGYDFKGSRRRDGSGRGAGDQSRESGDHENRKSEVKVRRRKRNET